MEPADVTFGLRFCVLVEVHLLNSPLKVHVEHRRGDSLSPVALSSSSLDWLEAFVVSPSQCR